MMRTSTLTARGSPSGWTSFFFDEAQQLGLQVELHVADLVEEERAAVGGADDAAEGGLGAGEGAAAIPEQLALEHVVWHCCAVDRHERLVGAIRGAMDESSEHFLAGAGFAGQEDGQRARGELPGDAHELHRLFRDPEAVGVGLERLGRP